MLGEVKLSCEALFSVWQETSLLSRAKKNERELGKQCNLKGKRLIKY
jgi:hypothetical protein